MKKILVLAMSFWALSACGKRLPTPPSSQATGKMAGTEMQLAETAPSPPLPPMKKRSIKYYPEGTPTRAIQDLDDMLDSYILDPKTPEQKQYNLTLKKTVISGTFDIRELCRLALAQHWGERTTQEQNYFVDLMLNLLEKKAIFSKEQGQQKQKSKGAKFLYQLTYEGERFLNPEKTQSLSKTMVHLPSENLKIELNYKLRKVGNEWKIYDVIVDGASLLDNYKYQFDKIIDKDGYPALVHRMEAKLKELQEKDQVINP